MATFLSIVIAVPAALHDKANAILWAVGRAPEDGDSFNMPASPDGKAPPTMYFLRSQETAPIIAIVQAFKAGKAPTKLPDNSAWADYKLAAKDLTDVGSGLVIDVKTQKELDALGWSYGDHVANVMKAQGVEPVQTNGP